MDATWINRVGMLLEFLSFWFAAPEILGERRLRKIEGVFERITKTHEIIGSIAAFGVSLLIARLLDKYGMMPEESMRSFCEGLCLSGIVIVIFTGAAKRIAGILLKAMADKRRVRKRSIALGVVLFVSGFLLQLAATF